MMLCARRRHKKKAQRSGGRGQKRQIGEMYVVQRREDKEGCRRARQLTIMRLFNRISASKLGLGGLGGLSTALNCLPVHLRNVSSLLHMFQQNLPPNFEDRYEKRPKRHCTEVGRGAAAATLFIVVAPSKRLSSGGVRPFGLWTWRRRFRLSLDFSSLPSFPFHAAFSVRRRCRTMRGLCSARHRDRERGEGTVLPPCSADMP